MVESTSNAPEKQNALQVSPRNFALACIGLLRLLADEIPALLERSVQRGSAVVERAQTEAKRRRAASPEAAPNL